MMLKQFKLMSSCWSRTKIKQINIYIIYLYLHGQNKSYRVETSSFHDCHQR